MKIAFIVSGFPVLSETFILNQITGLMDLGHDVEILAGNNPNEEKVHSDVEKYRLMEQVHFIPKHKIARILKVIYLMVLNFSKGPIKILKSLNFFKYGKDALSLYLVYWCLFFLNKKIDIIHCHFGPTGIIFTKLKEAGIRGKFVTSFHGYDLSNFVACEENDVYKKLFLDCDLCMPISDYWKKKLIELGCKEDRIKVHRMGIDLQKFNFSEKKIRPEESVKILTVGRLVEKKGHEYAIRAITKMIYRNKNVIYIIAGDGPLKNRLKSLVSESGINDYVNFLGAVDQNEVRKLYEQAHFLVLPSITAKNGDKEGIPVVLMEAQAAGLPVISTYHSGIPEVITDGKSGFLVPEKDADALSDRILYLIEHPELWPEMGSYGRKVVEKNYNIKILNQQLVEIYQDINREEYV